MQDQDLKTTMLSGDTDGIKCAARILTDGGLVGIPTETVYGLGADARRKSAVKRVYRAKGRPDSNPLIVHVAHIADAEEFVDFGPLALKLAEKFWPGPLTLVLPMIASCPVCREAAGGHKTLGLRIPSHPVARSLIEEFSGPIAAPSANISGRVSPTSVEHVLADLSGTIEAVVDGGPCSHGMESTILAPIGNEAILLRPGAVTRASIEKLAPVLDVPTGSPGPASPGQLERHYSPKSPLRLNAQSAGRGELLLGFGACDSSAKQNLSPSGTLKEAAHNLYGMLRQMDDLANRSGGWTIAVSPIPEIGVGVAINDRLRRAAHRTVVRD